jgi:hypothetical protein
MKGRVAIIPGTPELQSSPLFVKNDIKSFTRLERVGGTMHRNESCVVVRTGSRVPNQKDRGNI